MQDLIFTDTGRIEKNGKTSSWLNQQSFMIADHDVAL